MHGQPAFHLNKHRSNNDSIECLVTGNECFVYADTGPRAIIRTMAIRKCSSVRVIPRQPQFAFLPPRGFPMKKRQNQAEPTLLTYYMRLPDSKFSSN